MSEINFHGNPLNNNFENNNSYYPVAQRSNNIINNQINFENQNDLLFNLKNQINQIDCYNNGNQSHENVEKIKCSIFDELTLISSQYIAINDKLKHLLQENSSLKNIIKNKDEIISDYEITLQKSTEKLLQLQSINEQLSNYKMINNNCNNCNNCNNNCYSNPNNNYCYGCDFNCNNISDNNLNDCNKSENFSIYNNNNLNDCNKSENFSIYNNNNLNDCNKSENLSNYNNNLNDRYKIENPSNNNNCNNNLNYSYNIENPPNNNLNYDYKIENLSNNHNLNITNEIENPSNNNNLNNNYKIENLSNNNNLNNNLNDYNKNENNSNSNNNYNNKLNGYNKKVSQSNCNSQEIQNQNNNINFYDSSEATNRYLLESVNSLKLQLNCIANDYNKKINEKDYLIGKLNFDLQKSYEIYNSLNQDMENNLKFLEKENNGLKTKINMLSNEKDILLDEREKNHNEIISLRDKIINYTNGQNIANIKDLESKQNEFYSKFQNKEKKYIEDILKLHQAIVKREEEIDSLKEKYNEIVRNLQIENEGLKKRVNNIKYAPEKNCVNL